ncbi:GATA zinc finger domain-containing protein 8-like [Microplitis mediator]|uniref:GATA zinc finger domain-containing protein 8-like n=1 Tax=Microplitis mediator TaxID=375433 RepID=UPI00255453F4|nr:GATA zinc finger domain-containing protein 8-like [Microplitis mediator]
MNNKLQDFTAWATTSSSVDSVSNSEVNTDQLRDNKNNKTTSHPVVYDDKNSIMDTLIINQSIHETISFANDLVTTTHLVSKSNNRTRRLINPKKIENSNPSELFTKNLTNFRRKFSKNTNGTSTNRRRLLLKKNTSSNDDGTVNNNTTPDSLITQELKRITSFTRNVKPKNNFINLNRTHNAGKNNKFDLLSRTMDPNNKNKNDNTDGKNRRLHLRPFSRISTTGNYSSLNTTTSTINTGNNVSNVSTQAPSIPNNQNRPKSFLQKEYEKAMRRAFLESLDNRRKSHF